MRDGPYRFREVVCRDEGGRRFKVPVPWMPGGGEAGTPLSEGHITITSTLLTNKKKAKVTINVSDGSNKELCKSYGCDSWTCVRCEFVAGERDTGAR